MDYLTTKALDSFDGLVALKFQLYNSLFTALPFHKIEKTGILLSLLSKNCEEDYLKGHSPTQIIDSFFEKQTTYVDPNDRLDLLFRFVQYVERQVVLFDALEDAAFSNVNNLAGAGTLKSLESDLYSRNMKHKLAAKLKEFAVRIVLTAHPTQFYPGPVLGIINDLAKALSENQTTLVNSYLQQLGKTPFFKKQKPTPYDEAVSLIWYLENVFYPAAGRIINLLKPLNDQDIAQDHPIVNMGFWPGGDRDGNPFVTTDITLQVVENLRSSIVKCYYYDVRRLRRRMTFDGVFNELAVLEQKLYDNHFIPGHKTDISKKEITDTLKNIRAVIVERHNGLFLGMLDDLINKVDVFGLHFASLDIRQDSSVHGDMMRFLSEKGVLPLDYENLDRGAKERVLVNIKEKIEPDFFEDPVHQDTIKVIGAIRTIQNRNGEQGCNRYIISQCQSAENALEVFGLFLLAGWKKDELTIDIVPLFETVDDLHQASDVMAALYQNPDYRNHLARRRNLQTIMVGFSDGTKDGGYMMANWSIYKAKEELTKISKQYGIDIIFFDGRGGPPARGGGKTHKFYASMGKNISNREIQITVQGQTVSSNFGTVEAAQYNIEQLIHAGLANDLISEGHGTLNHDEEALIETMAESGYDAYMKLKNHPDFLEYLSQVSPLRYYSDTNIGSRPAKRGGGAKMTMKDLRAIPFVGSWSQLKQNVTGYYGVGTALSLMDEQGKMDDLKRLYKESLFFRTLMDNCEMSMMKTFFPLTAFLRDDPRFGELWNTIYQEFELTKRYVLILSGQPDLMSNYPVERLSIQMRERIVLPLLTIQQYAIAEIRKLEGNDENVDIRKKLEKLVMRCSFGIINASRNSA